MFTRTVHFLIACAVMNAIALGAACWVGPSPKKTNDDAAALFSGAIFCIFAICILKDIGDIIQLFVKRA